MLKLMIGLLTYLWNSRGQACRHHAILWGALGILVAIGGCSKPPPPPPAPTSPAALATPGVAGGNAQSAQTKLAYSHNLELKMPSGSVKPHCERAIDRCLNDTQLNCVVLNAWYNGPDEKYMRQPQAGLTVRLPQDAVAAFEGSLLMPMPGEKGDAVVLLSQATEAEDLAKAITDLEQRQGQLTDYRDRLTALAKREDARIEDLIKIESELSNVQSQLEAIAAEKRGLDQRVATEKLTIRFSTQAELRNFQQPIAQAWRNIGSVLGESTGYAISFSVAALPWLPIIVLGLLLLRFIFRRWRR